MGISPSIKYVYELEAWRMRSAVDHNQHLLIQLPLVAADHNQLEIMTSEMINPIDAHYPQPSTRKKAPSATCTVQIGAANNRIAPTTFCIRGNCLAYEATQGIRISTSV